MNPADAESDARWPESIRQRHNLGRTPARDHDPVHLRPLDETLEDALLLGGFRQRCMEVAVEIVFALDPEDASLAARVGRLQDTGEANGLERAPALDERADGGERRLRHAFLGKSATHDNLVPHPVRNRRADRRQAEAFGHRGDDRNRAIGRDGQRAVDAVASRYLRHRIDVREVDGLPDVGGLKAKCVGVPVDGDDTDALFPRLQDRTPLVAPGADEEDSLHRDRMLVIQATSRGGRPRKQERHAFPAGDLAAVRATEASPER